MIYKILAIFLLTFLVSTAVGQQTIEDIVHLKDGTIIRGEVMEYDPKGKIKIKIKGGSLITYDSTEVTKIEKIKPEEGFQQYAVEQEQPLHLKKEGWYHSIMGGMTFSIQSRAISGVSGLPFGLTADYTFGYQFNQYFGLGASVGILVPNFEAYVPVCVNFRGYFLKTSANVFYDMNIGYGLSLNGLITSGTRNGGLHWSPAIGVRFASKKKGHVAVSLGYLMQIGGVHEYRVSAIVTKVGVTF
jgi:hypothetical protein